MAIEQMTFTVVQGGKGFNASLPSGYQVKGCSPGLQRDAALREQVTAICTHYGQVVYDGRCSAVAAAMDKESAWYRRKQGPPQAFGPQVLDEFPVVWSYAQSSGEWWAATRTCYRGPCPDGKPGNFFSHALVFRPEDLRQQGNNPLALCRSGLFMACDPGDSTTLPTLVDLGPASAARLDAELLGRPPWRDRIGAILLALARARSGGRPVVLCVANWREVPPLVEGLLALLPPSARCRTAICTFESDPHWLPSFNGPRRRDRSAAHHLLVLCGTDDTAWNLYADDYESRFAVFNFVGDRFSELPAARAFSAFTVDCLQRNHLPRIEQYHHLMERFEVEGDVDAWDRLAQAVGLLEVRSQPRDVAAEADALLALAKGPRQAAAALDLLLPWLPVLAAADNHQTLSTVTSRLVALAGQMPAEFAALQPIMKMVRPLAAAALAAGRGRSLAALLQACGAEEDALLLELAKDLFSTGEAGWTRTPDPRDQDALVELLMRAVRLAWAKLPGDPAISSLLAPLFRAAAGSGKTAEAWRQTEKIVRSALGGPWDEQQRQAARKLARYLTPDACPPGNAWLNVELLYAEKPQGEDLLNRLQSIAAACGKFPEGVEVINRLLAWVGQTLTAGDLAVALGRMAEATMGTAVVQKVLEQYGRAKKGITAEQLAQVRRQLAQAGAGQVLLQDLCEETRPWREASQKKLQSLLADLLDANPNILPGLCSGLALRLAQPELRQHGLKLAQHVLKSIPRSAPCGPWLAEFFAAMADAIPFGPLADEFRTAFAALPGGLETPAMSRLGFMKFMGDVEAAAARPGWSLAQFPLDQAAWRKVLHLSAEEQSQAAAWCDDHLLRLGIATPEDARHLVGLLEAAGRGSAEQILDVVQRMIYGRDEVTCVVVASAFAHCGLTNSRPPAQAEWSALAEAIVKTFKRKTRKLYKAHLAQLFYQPNLRRWKRLPTPAGPRGTDAAMTFMASRVEDGRWRRLLRNPWIIALLSAIVLGLMGAGAAVIWREPQDAEAYCRRGDEYALQGRFEKAAKDYKEAIDRKPHFVDAYFKRASVLEKLNDPVGAIENDTKLIKLLSDNVDASNSAIVEFHRELAKACCERGVEHASQHDFKNAIVDFTDAIHFDDKLAKAYHERGTTYKALGEEAEAKKDFDKATTLGYKPD